MQKSLPTHIPKVKENTGETDFQKEVNAYIDVLLEREKRDFRPGGLEPFESHARKIRTQISGVLNQFQERYKNGYQAIVQYLQSQGISQVGVSDDALEVFQDVDTFMNELEQGKEIYELLGFSTEQITQFFTSASYFLQEENFEKARDAFYFLTIIAPEIGMFWLGLSISLTKLGDDDASLSACFEAIDIDPQNPETYLQALHLLVQKKEFEKALALCDQGIALGQQNEPWAEELESTLQIAKNYIKTISNKG